MKTNQFIIKISLCFAFLFSFTAISQSIINAEELTQEWNLLKEQDGIKLYTREQKCKVGPLEKPLSYTFVKIMNETGESKNVYFQIGLHYDQGCEGCDDNEESKRAVNVAANSSVECDCTFAKGELSLLIANPNYPDSKTFEALELIELKVD